MRVRGRFAFFLARASDILLDVHGPVFIVDTNIRDFVMSHVRACLGRTSTWRVEIVEPLEVSTTEGVDMGAERVTIESRKLSEEDYTAVLRVMVERCASIIVEVERMLSTVRASIQPVEGTCSPVDGSCDRGWSWAEAVDNVLTGTLKPLTTSAIVRELRGVGGKFASATDPSTLVRRVLRSHADERRWMKVDGAWIKSAAPASRSSMEVAPAG